jgi:hypothetical protein
LKKNQKFQKNHLNQINNNNSKKNHYSLKRLLNNRHNNNNSKAELIYKPLKIIGPLYNKIKVKFHKNRKFFNNSSSFSNNFNNISNNSQNLIRHMEQDKCKTIQKRNDFKVYFIDSAFYKSLKYIIYYK